MNMQERIDRDLRANLGDMMVQVIILRAQMEDLNEQLEAAQAQIPPAKPNGKDKSTHQEEGHA